MLDKNGYIYALRICNIIAFLQQQWLRERVSILRCMYLTSLVTFY